MYPYYKGEPIVFECLQCGKCCVSLVKDTPNVKRSLVLFPEEKQHFSETEVSPFEGIGKTIWDIKPVKYQLNTEPCSKYDTNSKSCKEYQKRPLSCRRFPLAYSNSPEATYIADSTDCKFIEKVEKEKGMPLNFTFTPDTFIAPECWNALKKEIDKNQDIWVEMASLDLENFIFDMEKEEWKLLP
ncbi:MAG: YkgJ family cysteine cluster protein [Candidatus Hodarchaeales archaeon]